MGQTVEIVIDTFQHYHSLPLAIYGQSHVLDSLRGHLHLRQTTYLSEHRVIGRCRLPHRRCHLELRGERREERRHEIMKTVEYAQRHYKRHRRHSHTNHRYAAYHVDSMRTFL